MIEETEVATVEIEASMLPETEIVASEETEETVTLETAAREEDHLVETEPVSSAVKLATLLESVQMLKLETTDLSKGKEETMTKSQDPSDRTTLSLVGLITKVAVVETVTLVTISSGLREAAGGMPMPEQVEETNQSGSKNTTNLSKELPGEQEVALRAARSKRRIQAGAEQVR